uniref:Endoplasmic reticulum resident protein 27 n=1 Tax=Caenorhabditis tropicalis TaxID=1561998 RepID=A0A1I7TBF8_9PELO
MVSLHTFNIWSEVAEKIKVSEDTVLAHVPCHDNSDFCQGLNSEDYHTVVSYKNGQNTGKTENIGDEEFYERWIELNQLGSFNKLENESKLSEFKKGIVRGKKRSSVTIGVFPSEKDTSFQHFQIAAENLAGKYYVAYFINENSKPAITTYRFAEKQKRTDYSGKFDPATLMEFITKSSFPSIIDISHGFTTDILFHQKRQILILIGGESEPFSKLASRQDARKSYIFTKVDGENENVQKMKASLGIVDDKPTIVLLNKDRVHLISTSKPKCPDHLQKILQALSTAESTKVLSTKDPHPLRYLQVQKVNEVFGFEETIVLPDHTLFLDSNPFSSHPPIPQEGGTGGCPFMQGGGTGVVDSAHHSEL